jgi:hypothetical protein
MEEVNIYGHIRNREVKKDLDPDSDTKIFGKSDLNPDPKQIVLEPQHCRKIPVY